LGSSLQEFLIIVLLIAVLSATGLWPRIAQGLRELRGEQTWDNIPQANDLDLCYKMLGVSPSARWEDVERAYRQKAKIHHPDRGGDDDTMRALNEAYAHIKSARRAANA
jgi:DnaJ-domain-containing protein 1